jgi:hypothetical protein
MLEGLARHKNAIEIQRVRVLDHEALNVAVQDAHVLLFRHDHGELRGLLVLAKHRKDDLRNAEFRLRNVDVVIVPESLPHCIAIHSAKHIGLEECELSNLAQSQEIDNIEPKSLLHALLLLIAQVNGGPESLCLELFRLDPD